MKVGIVGKTDNGEVVRLTKLLVDKFSSYGVEVCLEEGLAGLTGHENSFQAQNIHKHSDVVIVLGGDGTFLGVSRTLSGTDIPIVGINMGNLGFLTEVTREEALELVDIIAKGSYDIETREMISTRVIREGKEFCSYDVLNDVVISRGIVSRVVDLAIEVNGKQITTVKADGLILSTPTGSTAYSLSAGGPIVFPTLPLMIITPICPHTLTNRPLVVSNQRKIKVRSLSDNTELHLTLDGQISFDLMVEDIVEVTKSEKSVKFIRSPFRDYFSILKTKLMWGERYGTI
ncbi:MAG: NAD(+)/NADH kinase [Candidatus Dadabacteria bacterium]|nr:NAD(+)/NADH kinase [Candidatus Dadabacteria bacterium]NIS10342.1 NAD(+)/NADH kinase [Candidatus Dadabacteria bacterium]NIY23251.1 NAD(+) kinase [Candidatus Dadabacteria bacterium]